MKIKIFLLVKMSTLSSFSIYFITADNRAVPLQFIPNPNQVGQGRLVLNPDLNQDLTSSPAVFTLDSQSDSLQRNNGFYLGATYKPTILINNQKYYLSRLENGSYALKTVSDNNTFSFSLLNPKINWETPDAIAHLHVNNLTVPNIPVIGYYFHHQPLYKTSQPLTFSPIDCQNCGSDVCPENFTLINSKCVSAVTGGIPIGIRTKQGIYTYKMINGKAVAAIASPSVITSRIETNDTVRERWFYIDPLSDNKLTVGKSYPIYNRQWK